MSGPERARLVVLSGSGVIAESGLRTFRGAGGLWEGSRVEDVVTQKKEADGERSGSKGSG